MATKTEKAANPDGKRVTVLFNWDDYELIEAEIDRRQEASGYSANVSDALRQLVRDNWKPAA